MVVIFNIVDLLLAAILRMTVKDKEMRLTTRYNFNIQFFTVTCKLIS